MANSWRVLFCAAVMVVSSLRQAQAVTDKLGVTKIYPTITGGKEWFSAWTGTARKFGYAADPKDPWTHGKGNATYAIDGLGNMKITGATPRLYIYDPALVRSWRNVEMTVYAMRVADDGTAFAGIVGIARSNHLSEATKRCDTRGYGARIRYDGNIDFDKETSHPNAYSVGLKRYWTGGMPRNTWIGYKHVVYDKANGNVVNELWMDKTNGLNGGTWVKILTHEDNGANMGVGGVACKAGVNPALRLTASSARAGSETGKPNLVVYFRSTNVGTNGLVYKKMSVREIKAP